MTRPSSFAILMTTDRSDQRTSDVVMAVAQEREERDAVGILAGPIVPAAIRPGGARGVCRDG